MLRLGRWWITGAIVLAVAGNAGAWSNFQTADALQEFPWEFGLGVDLSLGTTSASAGLNGDLWLKFRDTPYMDSGIWATVSKDTPFLAATTKIEMTRGEHFSLALDLGLGGGVDSDRKPLLRARGGLLADFRFARHLALYFGGHYEAVHQFETGAGIGTSIPLVVGFEIGGSHVNFRPEVQFFPNDPEHPTAAFGLSFR